MVLGGLLVSLAENKKQTSFLFQKKRESKRIEKIDNRYLSRDR